jgi:4a-hydroxytetrahydrobiopterin dehydratase
MEVQSAEALTKKKCLPCEGGVEACPLPKAKRQLTELEGWSLTHEGKRIRKDWKVKNFMAGMEFFHKVAEIAEEEGHHPGM